MKIRMFKRIINLLLFLIIAEPSLHGLHIPVEFAEPVQNPFTYYPIEKALSKENSSEFLFGVLITKGQVMLDGFPTQTGSVVLTDQTLATGAGEVTIDLGPRGRIVLGPKSKIHLKFTDKEIRI